MTTLVYFIAAHEWIADDSQTEDGEKISAHGLCCLNGQTAQFAWARFHRRNVTS
jgi:hypothetical protein